MKILLSSSVSRMQIYSTSKDDPEFVDSTMYCGTKVSALYENYVRDLMQESRANLPHRRKTSQYLT